MVTVVNYMYYCISWTQQDASNRKSIAIVKGVSRSKLLELIILISIIISINSCNFTYADTYIGSYMED